MDQTAKHTPTPRAHAPHLDAETEDEDGDDVGDVAGAAGQVVEAARDAAAVQLEVAPAEEGRRGPEDGVDPDGDEQAQGVAAGAGLHQAPVAVDDVVAVTRHGRQGVDGHEPGQPAHKRVDLARCKDEHTHAHTHRSFHVWGCTKSKILEF